MQQMHAQSSPNFVILENEDLNHKSVCVGNLPKNKAKTNANSNMHRFHAASAHYNEMIIFEYVQLCQILDVAALADWCSDVQRRHLI